MVANYLKSALRNIARHKGYSAINILGLAIGIASSLAAFLWVMDETSYDTFHTNGDSIYRCNRHAVSNEEGRFDAVTSAPVGPTVAGRTPGILNFARTMMSYQKLHYELATTIESGLYVDPSFLTMFSFSLAQGDAQTALKAPESIVLTERTAVRLFGDADPMGKTLDNGLTVTGVIRDVPDNSSIQFQFLIPMAYGEATGRVTPDAWFEFGYRTYFQMREGADIEQIGLQIRDIFQEIEPTATLTLLLQPLRDIHLVDPGGGGKIVYVYVFTVIAILLLAVACINFMNLSTARASRRSGEIGIRKAVGASRTQLTWQVLTESFIQTVTGTLIAICLLETALPHLEGLFGKQLDMEYSATVVLGLIAVTALVALAAGIYPACVLSSFRPASVLKGKGTANGHPLMNRFRRTLVVFQFMVSSGLIFGALVINSQLNYIDNKDLGVDKENIITFRAEGLASDYETIKSELLQHPGVLGVTAAMEPPAWCGWHAVGFDFEGRQEGQYVRAGFAWVDYDYLDVFGMEIVQGRNFSREYATDETAYIINETAARAMNMDEPVGKTMGFEEKPGKIIGVVKDFHFSSLHAEIAPLIIGIDESFYEYLCVKISPDDIQGTLGFIKQKWNQLRVGEDFTYRFFDDLLGRNYRAEAQTSQITFTFTLITVLVACLGLFGLAAYSAERRTKEIGIRKVLGSSEVGIVGLLTKEFLLLVVLGNVIVAPVAYYSASRWLENFAYRIEPGWETFTISMAIAVLIALATVCYQAVRAARSNPVDSLRYE